MGRPRNFNRADVLEKAMPLFWKRGFADTGLKDLEKATGVNKSGLYSEFKNKEDLYLATLRHYAETRKARELLMEEPYGWGNIERFLKLKLAAKGALRGCFAVNSMREAALLPPEAQEIVAANRANLKRLFRQNIAAEETGLDADALVEILSTFFSGLCIEMNLKAVKPAEKKVEDFLQALRAL